MSKKSRQAAQKICNRCGQENDGSADKCSACDSTRFAPDWVKALRRVNRQVSVEVTASNPQYGESVERITLSKWWPKGSSTFHLPNAKQWNAIEQIVNNDLGPFLGWKTQKEIVERIQSQKKKSLDAGSDVKQLATEYPEVVKQVISAIDPSKIHVEDMGDFMETMTQLSEAVGGMSTGFKEAFLTLVKKLPAQGKRAIEDLEKLLEDWSLHQVNTVAQQVQSRIATIELFKKQIQDERTYEISGDNSIHRILERAMWLIDERYWLMYSNTTLRKQIGEEMSKRDKKKYGKKRPDFVCGTIDKKLILVELKRPSHTLKIEDVNQLETYLTLAEKYGDHSSYEAYLIGSKKDNELTQRIKYRSGFKIRTYTDLIADTERRYSEFLSVMK